MHDQIENLVSQIRLLPFEERLLLIQRVAAELQESFVRTGGVTESTPDSRLGYGKYRNAGDRMSSEEDFALAEWHPTEKELDGE
jgi:hypothetical protein